mmetsp:Transcript_4921/g.15296  ORF Transcript_4921/g.15296 Transcript_4921/m.15296 type:complete len:371 (-) Transcript_4921:714-1826(-)
MEGGERNGLADFELGRNGGRGGGGWLQGAESTDLALAARPPADEPLELLPAGGRCANYPHAHHPGSAYAPACPALDGRTGVAFFGDGASMPSTPGLPVSCSRLATPSGCIDSGSWACAVSSTSALGGQLGRDGGWPAELPLGMSGEYGLRALPYGMHQAAQLTSNVNDAGGFRHGHAQAGAHLDTFQMAQQCGLMQQQQQQQAAFAQQLMANPAWVRMLQLQAAHGMAGAMGAMGANGMGGQHAGGQMRHMGAPQLGGASGAGALGAYGGAVSGVAAGCLDAQMHVAMAREHQAQMQQQWLASLQTQTAGMHLGSPQPAANGAGAALPGRPAGGEHEPLGSVDSRSAMHPSLQWLETGARDGGSRLPHAQ